VKLNITIRRLVGRALTTALILYLVAAMLGGSRAAQGIRQSDQDSAPGAGETAPSPEYGTLRFVHAVDVGLMPLAVAPQEAPIALPPKPLSPVPVAKPLPAEVGTAVSAPEALAPLSPTTGTGFMGLASTDNVGYTVDPPDPNGAIGPNHFVEIANVTLRVFSRTGTAVTTVSLDAFFGSTGAFDPQILYDAMSGAWFASAVAIDSAGAGTGRLYVAVSETDDPTGTWHVYQDTLSGDFQDYPGLGVSDDKLAVSYNRFGIANPYPYHGVQTLVVEKADLLGHVASPAMARVPADPDTARFTIRPAQSLSTTSTQYMVSVDCCTATQIHIYRLTGTPAGGNLSVAELTRTITSLDFPPDAVQPGTAKLISTGDNRLLGASWRNGKLWTTATNACNGGYACGRFIEYDTGSDSVLRDFNVGASGHYYYYPAVRADVADDALAVLSHSSASVYPEVVVAARLSSDPANTMRGPFVLKTGETFHDNVLCPSAPSSCRWGDYLGAAVDPSDSSVVWVVGEYAKNDGRANWGTWIDCLSLTPSSNHDGEVIPTGRGPGPDVTNPMGDLAADGCDPDADNDGLPNTSEGVFPIPGCPQATAATDPLNPDSDGDGVIDGVECSLGTDPASAASRPAADSTCADPDADGVRSVLEVRGWGTDPNVADSDGDGKADGVELADVNGDGSLNFTDALIIAKAASVVAPFAPGPLTAAEKRAYDLDRNAVVNFFDALLVAKRAAALPAC